MVNPIHLRTLLEVVRLGSFAGAANRLGYTPSAVSQQMASLEQDAGVQLFERSARSVRSTEAAQAMARHAITVLTSIDHLLEAATNAERGVRSELRVGIFPSLAAVLLPRLLADPALSGADSGITLHVSDPSPTIQAIRSGEEYDVALVYRVGERGLAWPQSMTSHWLGDDRFRVVVPAAWGLHGRGPLMRHELVGLPWVFHHPGSSDAAIVEELFRVAELRPRRVGRSDDLAVTLAMVASGFAASYVPEIALHSLPEGVVVLSVPELHLVRGLFALVSQSAAEEPHAQEFLIRVRGTLAELGFHVADDTDADWGASGGAGIGFPASS